MQVDSILNKNTFRKLRTYLNVDAAQKVFEMMIVPILTYSALVNLQLTRTQQQKLNSIERRANKVIGGQTQVMPISKRRKKNACRVVHKCINGKLCPRFDGNINMHTQNTRNQNKLLKLPKVKLEFGKKSFKFQGAKLFNELPILNRTSEILIKQFFNE